MALDLSNRICFVSHGGGPLPLLGDAGHREMTTVLREIAESIPRPRSIIVISAHWEALAPTVTAGENPGLIYDYFGFPPESYSIKYPSPGNPKLADEVLNSLANRGFAAVADQARGFDHGHFVPLKIMYPEADIPAIQLSLSKSLEPNTHLEIGRALADLDDSGVLILGSGFSFHNLREFFRPMNAESAKLNEDFEAWLVETISSTELSDNERFQRMLDWESAPGSRFCHPREEHLLPLHVCLGAAKNRRAEKFQCRILGVLSSFFLW
ncbi:MAG: class III extradiol ring-cleavage dioxygenase [Pyrinomonadaceae bacterium]